MKNVTILFLVVIIVSCNNVQENFKSESDVQFSFYDILNGEYKQQLINDSFPLSIIEHPCNIADYLNNNELIFNDIVFHIGKAPQSDIDTSYKWLPNELLNYRIISIEETKIASEKDQLFFSKNFGKGFVLVSQPVFNENKDFLVFKEIKVFGFNDTHRPSISSYHIYRKNEIGLWNLFQKNEIIPN